ncbi:amidohydrolase family protein [Parasphingorhabdus sp. JC815]|uniref:amidohydrolase family protein n=1 Tax=Parasphingorhabdus sp. JC815 TaxID=3232140 RepID=UPI0034580736
MDRYLVISSDGHVGLPPERYREYLESAHHEKFDEVLAKEIKAREEHEKLFLIDDFNTKWRARVGDGLEGAWNGDIRNRVLDEDGVVAEVLFPDGITERNAPPFGADIGLRPNADNAVLQWAGARAHNRWLADFCAEDPLRRLGLAVIPALYDIDQTIEAIHLAKKNGMKGVFFPALTDGYDMYNHTKYYPVWELLQEYNLPLHFHSGASPGYDVTQPGWIGTYLCEFAFWMTRPLWSMIFGGVFEIYPDLKVCFTEAGGEFWFPWMVELMDIRASAKHTSGKLGDYNTNMTMKPSEYFARNIFVGCSALPDEETTEAYYKIGIDRILWGTDYPHPEGTWPGTLEKMQLSLGGLPEDDIQKMLGTNALEIYDVDPQPLWDLASKIGPKRSHFVKEAAE